MATYNQPTTRSRKSERLTYAVEIPTTTPNSAPGVSTLSVALSINRITPHASLAGIVAWHCLPELSALPCQAARCGLMSQGSATSRTTAVGELADGDEVQYIFSQRRKTAGKLEYLCKVFSGEPE